MSTKIRDTSTHIAPAGAPPSTQPKKAPPAPAAPADAVGPPRANLPEPTKALTSPVPPPPKGHVTVARSNMAVPPVEVDSGVENAKNRALRSYAKAPPERQDRARQELARPLLPE